MSNITIVLPRNVRKIVRDKYTELWQEWKNENPNSRAYPISKLNQNIRRALSVNGRVLNEDYFENSRYNGWSGRKVLPWCHWYYLVRFQQDQFGKITAIIENALYEGDYHNDTMNTKPYGEGLIRKSLIENRLKRIIYESLIKVLNEEKGKKKVGDYTALDGQWWDGLPHGLEHKGLVQDVRMYDKPHKDGMIDTIGLFRRCDNRKFFYARIIPIKDSKETKWKQIKRTDVPQKILDDFATINSQGHEPYPVL